MNNKTKDFTLRSRYELTNSIYSLVKEYYQLAQYKNIQDVEVLYREAELENVVAIKIDEMLDGIEASVEESRWVS
jgi:hypothetical protein